MKTLASPFDTLTIAIGGALVAFFVILAIWPMPLLMSLLSDDAFYYLRIGSSIASGYGSTFDGIGNTNGYHPLWMLIVVLVFELTGNQQVLSASVALACGLLFCGATFLLAARIVNRYVSLGSGHVVAATLLSPFAFSALTNGMETALAIFSVLGVVWVCFTTKVLEARGETMHYVALGAVLGLSFLSRLDLVFLPIAAGFLVLVNSIRANDSIGDIIRRALAMLLPFLALSAPYLAFNFIEFGGITPISGTVKSSFPNVRESLHLEGDSTIGLAMLLVLTFLTLIAQKFHSSVRSKQFSVAPLLLLTLASWFHFSYVYFFMDWGVYWWHFSLSAASLAIALPAALASMGLTKKSFTFPAVAVVAIAGAAIQYEIVVNRYERHVAWLEAAEWARSNTSPDAIFALKDAGLFSYFASRQVVNLDGKANSKAYWQRVQDRSVEQYLAEIGVSYIGEINAYCEEGVCSIRIFVPNRTDVFLEMRDQDLVYVGPAYPGRIGLSAMPDARFRIWQ